MKHLILWSTRLLVLCCAVSIVGTVSEINAALKTSPKVGGIAISPVDTTAMMVSVQPKNSMRAETKIYKAALARW